MRTITQLEQEADRIFKIKENATFVIKSLRDKIEYLKNLFSTECEEVIKSYELGYKEKNMLESNVVRFLDGESCFINIETASEEGVDNNG